MNQARQQHRQDELERIAIEGKFGQGKRRFSLARVMAKLAVTSEVVIMVSFKVMNLEKILSGCLYFWLQAICGSLLLRIGRQQRCLHTQN